MVDVMRGTFRQPEPDARSRIVNEAIQAFEKTHEFKVANKARQYLINETLIPPYDFSVALQDGKINSAEISGTIGKALVLAKQLSMERGLDLIDRQGASDATHRIVEIEMDCPWPWIIC